MNEIKVDIDPFLFSLAKIDKYEVLKGKPVIYLGAHMNLLDSPWFMKIHSPHNQYSTGEALYEARLVELLTHEYLHIWLIQHEPTAAIKLDNVDKHGEISYTIIVI